MPHWLGPVVVNLAIFVAFFACCTFHHWLEYRKHPHPTDSARHAFYSGIFNPATIDSVKDFLTHIFVYSGYIIPPH